MMLPAVVSIHSVRQAVLSNSQFWLFSYRLTVQGADHLYRLAVLINTARRNWQFRYTVLILRF